MICEQHTTTTSDGYILTLFRMKKQSTKSGARVAFLQHGLFADAFTWIMHDKESLAVVLANQGYDVWLGNNRGSQFSRTHKTLDIHKDYKKFFDYSFYELGKYDAPA